ncbi:nucleolin 1 isoform X1 [Benincasa hispida]|uniref:nucleolin 1 isoform X1 n=1 Tax=Benincasa hispida TaxID=102211 RepID=UPI001900C605|nr:nucleolin 1 isoform X1 [Benincasa hispida]
MGSEDPVDDRTFKVDFTGEGMAKLRERIKLKMKEFMGDYTDDTLVEYVIVLLRNGRRKEEAQNELNVFLADDSHSFVSWLWDHLASSMDLYVEPPTKSSANEVPRPKSPVAEPDTINNSHNLESDSERGKSEKLSSRRRNREWRGIANDETRVVPRSEVSRVKHSSPEQVPSHRKRSRADDHQGTEREAAFQVSIAAPRRLLQFAMRDAVATTRPSSAAKEPHSKRLRSVVSTSNSDTTNCPRRLQSVAKVPNPMATVIKAVTEAAEDVVRVKSSSVFDRLGRQSRDMDLTESSGQLAEYGVTSVENDKYGDMNHTEDRPYSATYLERNNYSGKYALNEAMFEPETELASDSASENEDVNIQGHRIFEDSWTAESGVRRGGNLRTVPFRAVENSDDERVTQYKQKDQPSLVANSSRDIVNISVNVNTWKPPHYQDPGQIPELAGQKFLQESELQRTRSAVQVMENGEPVTLVNQRKRPAPDLQKEFQKPPLSANGQFPGTRPLEEADARTIFVSNVHFAATKDSLSRHFNKFGEVVKVIIVTDATTGQPRGSAYVEFMRKESAENALSLDGTSFMSRILKVVRKNASQVEGASTATWPRAVRGSPFPTPRFTRVPFMRGVPGGFRARSLMKLGARSMQWKRDSQTTTAETGASPSGNSVPSSGARSLTYVRTESKPANK